MNQMQKAIEDRDYSCGIFLDFGKAFDTVNHNILLSKLEFYGIRGVVKDLFTSYLRNRMQMMSLVSVNSDIQTVCCGVPQGSVLGPLLFLIYINDFHNCSELLDFHLFADNASLFFKHKDINILESEINSELANLHIWLSANKLSLNIEKSNFIIFRHAVVNFICSFEVKAHAIHKNRAQTKSQQQRIELVSQINQSYIFINELQKTLGQR